MTNIEIAIAAVAAFAFFMFGYSLAWRQGRHRYRVHRPIGRWNAVDFENGVLIFEGKLDERGEALLRREWSLEERVRRVQ